MIRAAVAFIVCIAAVVVSPVARQTSSPVQRTTFWCPMHPNERSPVPVACPICKMAMVPIPTPRVGEYRMDVTQIAGRGGALAGLRITVREPQGGPPVQALELLHERPMHLFVISRSLEFFAHVHPQTSAAGAFEVRERIPPGEYMVVADFMPTGGSPQTLQRFMITPGFRAEGRPAVLKPGVEPAVAHGIRLKVVSDPVELLAGRNAHLRFTLASAASGQPITDLEPYLGAAAHLFIASADLTETMHAHPDETTAAGSEIVFDLTLPKPGQYKMWIQFQRRGVFTTASVVVSAR